MSEANSAISIYAQLIYNPLPESRRPTNTYAAPMSTETAIVSGRFLFLKKIRKSTVISAVITARMTLFALIIVLPCKYAWMMFAWISTPYIVLPLSEAGW